jgi:predicted deacetylase
MGAVPPRLLVSVSGLEPGAPLAAAVALVDVLDARRVPATLLVGPRPHPEVVAWATARRRVGDTALLHGTRPELLPGRPYRRLPAHEAGLRLAAALRTRDALGLAVDGFAAPGWATSAGTRAALAAADVGLVVDDAGAHRLAADGGITASWRGPVAGPGRAPPTRRRAEPDLVHLALPAGVDAATVGALVDEALAAGATPLTAGELVPRRGPRTPRAAGDPEHWSITA